jgi:ABC-type branched-subunit amino acid transport system permease subunit
MSEFFLKRSALRRNSEFVVVGIIALFVIIVLPVLNAKGIVSDFTVQVWGKYFCYALLAISVDLLWGYTGLLSLGQALFFSLGGYMLGMHLMLMIGKQGMFAQSGQNPNLIPDFMFFLGHTVLPTFWKPFFSTRTRATYSTKGMPAALWKTSLKCFALRLTASAADARDTASSQ